MTNEYFRNEIFHRLSVDIKVSSVLGPAYQQQPQRRVWMYTGDDPVVTAFDMSQRSQWSPITSYVTLWAFIGTEPPGNFFDWDMQFRIEGAPRILAVSGQHVEGLPRHLDEWDDNRQSERDAEKIAQAARLVFGHIRTPEGMIALTERLAASDPRMPRILGINVRGQQKLGIRIT